MDLKPTRLAGARTRIPYGWKGRKARKHAWVKAKNLTISRADRRAQRMDMDSHVVDSAPREIGRRGNGGRKQPSCPGKRRRAGRRGALLAHHSRVGTGCQDPANLNPDRTQNSERNRANRKSKIRTLIQRGTGTSLIKTIGKVPYLTALANDKTIFLVTDSVRVLRLI
jgi:hypothetical protein